MSIGRHTSGGVTQGDVFKDLSDLFCNGRAKKVVYSVF